MGYRRRKEYSEVRLNEISASKAGIAQLGERQTEDLKVACSIHAHRNVFILFLNLFPAVNKLPLSFFYLFF